MGICEALEDAATKEASTGLQVAGLFAGIGGLELGLSLAGHHANLLCELDTAAAHVLKTRFSDVEVANDVRELHALPNGTGLVAAGFPCQDLSSSGQKLGISGVRSSLVGEVFRLLEKQPTEWVLIENVRFMLHLQAGRAMHEIASNFERLGYNWAYRVLNSNSFGLPQRRHRVFFLASRSGDPRDVLLSGDELPLIGKPSIEKPIGFYWTEGRYSTGLADDSIPPLKGGSSLGIPSAPAILDPSGIVGTPSLSDAERLQGFPAEWTLPAEEVIKASLRWKLIGNAVSVPAAEWVGKKLMNPVRYDATGDIPLKGKWPNAAWSINGNRFVSLVSDNPIAEKAAKLDGFLREPLKPLSAKAVDGFLRRAQAGNLNYPDGFLEKLKKYRANLI